MEESPSSGEEEVITQAEPVTLSREKPQSPTCVSIVSLFSGASGFRQCLAERQSLTYL